MNCTKCNNTNEYAEANQSDGSFVCYECRQTKSSESSIPTNLEECFVALKKIAKPEEIQKIMAETEDDMAQYHHGIGMWMRNNWGLWQGGPLQDYFKALGLWHADDMSGVILDSFYRHLKGIPLDVEEQIKYYLDYWTKQGINGPN